MVIKYWMLIQIFGLVLDLTGVIIMAAGLSFKTGDRVIHGDVNWSDLLDLLARNERIAKKGLWLIIVGFSFQVVATLLSSLGI